MTITMTITIKTMTMMIINTTICVLYISRSGECTVVDDSTHLAREREKGQMLLDHHR